MQNMPGVPSASRNFSAQRVFVVVVVLLLAWLAWSLRETLAPYIVGILIAQLLSPLVRLVEERMPGRGLKARTRHGIAAVSVFAAAALVVVVFLLFLARRLLNRMGDMILGLPADWKRAISENPTIHTWYVDTIPADVRAQIEKSLTEASIVTVTWLNRAVMSAISTVSGFVDAIITIVAVGLFVFYVMIRDERMPSSVGKWISPGWRLHLRHLREIAHETITSYTRALLTEATIVGSLTGIGLFLVGVNMALPLGVASGLFNLIPYLGYWLALLLSIVVVSGTQPDKLVLAIVVYLLVQSADNWYFAPHYQGGSTGWTPAQTLVIMACGVVLIGPIGLVIALPLAAFVRETLLYAYHELGGSPAQQQEVPEDSSQIEQDRLAQPEPTEAPAQG
jgi:predicted PurR-regulated permease PerM